MDNIEKLVRERRSFRTYDGLELTNEDKKKLYAFTETIKNPYGLPVEFKFLEKMSCPVVIGTEMYIGAKMKESLHLNEAFGYSFKRLYCMHSLLALVPYGSAEQWTELLLKRLWMLVLMK